MVFMFSKYCKIIIHKVKYVQKYHIEKALFNEKEQQYILQ